MSDSAVNVIFSAVTGDFESGLSSVRESLASLSGPISDLNGKYAALGSALFESHSRALQAIRANDEEAFAVSKEIASEALSSQIRAEQDGLREKIATYVDDARHYRLSEQEKISASREAIQETYLLELELLNQKRALASDSLIDRQRLDNQISQLERHEQEQLLALTRQSLDEQSREFQNFGNVVVTSFNSQIRGLLSGTETWREAFRRTLADLLINFIDISDRTVALWISSEVAKTTATESGTATRTALQQAGAAASLTSQGAAVVRSILSSAAETFAGVFGFLAPLMGPLALGPAAAAQATVAGAVGSVASADIGMWNVPNDMLTLVHHNELIMPAAEAGALREMLGGSITANDIGRSPVSISPSTHFYINAIDGASVSQWMRLNSAEMLRAIGESVRHGAHLGLRTSGR
jgi:hypothetical protein